MKQWLGSPSLRIAVAIAAYALVGRYLGVIAFVFASPLFAALIARPLMTLASNIRWRMRSHVWLPLHGQHYVFKGSTIHVIEDAQHHRWVCLADVRRVIARDSVSDQTLAVTYPGQYQIMGKPAQPHLRDDALVAHLGKQNALQVLKFRTWVERAIMRPGQKTRRHFGIQEVAHEPAADR